MNATTLLSDALGDVRSIEDKTLELFNLREVAKVIGEQIAGHEAEIYDAVCSEADAETSKPIYSNDGARKAAAVKRQAGHAKLQAARLVLQDANKKIAELNASISSLNDGVSLRRAFLHGGNFVAVNSDAKAAGSVPAAAMSKAECPF